MTPRSASLLTWFVIVVSTALTVWLLFKRPAQAADGIAVPTEPMSLGESPVQGAKDAPIVVGCRTMGRSQQAAAILEQAGFSNLLVQEAGFVGASPIAPGWGPKGLPTSQGAEPGRSWDELAAGGG